MTLVDLATLVAGGLLFAGGFSFGLWRGQARGYLEGLLDACRSRRCPDDRDLNVVFRVRNPPP